MLASFLNASNQTRFHSSLEGAAAFTDRSNDSALKEAKFTHMTRGFANQTAGCRTFQASRLKKSLDLENGDSNVKKLSKSKIIEENVE